jgi:hypothetical protein
MPHGHCLLDCFYRPSGIVLIVGEDTDARTELPYDCLSHEILGKMWWGVSPTPVQTTDAYFHTGMPSMLYKKFTPIPGRTRPNRILGASYERYYEKSRHSHLVFII